jgi:hypothetical protein
LSVRGTNPRAPRSRRLLRLQFPLRTPGGEVPGSSSSHICSRTLSSISARCNFATGCHKSDFVLVIAPTRPARFNGSLDLTLPAR